MGGKRAICDCVQLLTLTNACNRFHMRSVFEMIMFSKEGKGGTVTHLGGNARECPLWHRPCRGTMNVRVCTEQNFLIITVRLKD